MLWAGHVARMVWKWNAYSILVLSQKENTTGKKKSYVGEQYSNVS
jgi:hypothetical protein